MKAATARKLRPESSTLLASLKRHNPAKVRAYTSDDDVRDIAVPTRRRRWSQVIEAIEACAWSRVEMLDKSGAALGYVENTAPARELVDIGPALSASDAGELRLAERIVSMVTRAQRETMTFRDAEMTALLAAQGAVVREVVDGMRSLTVMYREQVAASADLATTRATAAAAAIAPDGGQLKELMEALPVLLQLLPVLRSTLGPGQSTPPPSNHRKGD